LLGPLTKDQIDSILSMYRLDAPDAWTGELKGDREEGALYVVRVQGADYVLRLLQRRTVDEMTFEKDLLLHLNRLGFVVPRLLQNMAKGAFTPWTRRGRYVSVFRYPEGRALGRFEIRAPHLRRLGAWLARFHQAAQSMAQRPRPRPRATLDGKLGRLARAIERKRMARRHAPMVEELKAAAAALPPRVSLPDGLVHGRLGLGAVRFGRKGRLGGVTDFEDARRGALVTDLARVVTEWCWCPDAEGFQGPSGTFRIDRLQAFLRSYNEARPLLREEWSALEPEVRRTCLHEAADRLLQSELRPRSPAYRDPRHYVARLRADLDGLSHPSPCERISTGLASHHQ